MNITIRQPHELNQKELFAINNLAAEGFGRDASKLLNDTLCHIFSAEAVQVATDETDVKAFAMYRRCLWR